MERRAVAITVAGHLCLDVIPSIRKSSGSLSSLLIPGKLVDVGPAITATGGAVSNTGLALHRLGVPARFMGKVGDDLFGRAIVDSLNRACQGAADGLIIAPGEQSSYSVVISTPDVDRIFLHCTGTNDTFAAADVNLDQVAETSLFHFGYPPLMKRMYEEEGAELVELLSGVKTRGVTVSLDMAKPDPSSLAGHVNWERILQRVLPFVDFFLPSFEEILFMLDRKEYDRLIAENADEEIIRCAGPELLERLSSFMLSMGAAVVMIKLGEHGIYVRTTADRERWRRAGAGAPADPSGWMGRELAAPVFEVEVVGTTGAGDCTIAGWLAGVSQGLQLEQCVNAAAAAGACNVEQKDATSGIPRWEHLLERMRQGWKRRSTALPWEGWVQDEGNGLWYGPNDARRAE